MFDPSDDFPSVADGLEMVTVNRPGDPIAAVVLHALRQFVQPGAGEASRGRDTAGDAAWHLPAEEIAQPPRPGDTITDASGQCWTVLEVTRRALGSRWRCVARNLVVYYRLDDLIDLEEAHFAKGDGGADEIAWQIWKTGLRARIQPTIATAEAEHEREMTAERFQVFLADALPPDRTLRVRGPDGAVYAINAYRTPDAIDALTEIDVVRLD